MTKKQTLRHSTDHVANQAFKAHGSVHMWMDGDFLYYEAMGPFNVELVDSLAVAQMEILRTTDYHGPWASVCTIVKSAMASPEALARYERLMKKPKPAGKEPVATAFVAAPEVEGAKLMMPKFAKIYSGIKRPFQSFESMDEARAWARTMMDQTRAAPGS